MQAQLIERNTRKKIVHQWEKKGASEAESFFLNPPLNSKRKIFKPIWNLVAVTWWFGGVWWDRKPDIMNDHKMLTFWGVIYLGVRWSWAWVSPNAARRTMNQIQCRHNEENLLYNISIGSRLPQAPLQSPDLNPTKNVWIETGHGTKEN